MANGPVRGKSWGGPHGRLPVARLAFKRPLGAQDCLELFLVLMLCILIFVSGMFVGGVLTLLCCRRSVQVVIDARNQQESIGKKQTRDVSVAVNEMNLPVFADWLDMHDSYYRTEKGTVMHLTPSCSYAKGRALARFHFCQKCLMMMWHEETSEISKPSLRSAESEISKPRLRSAESEISKPSLRSAESEISKLLLRSAE